LKGEEPDSLIGENLRHPRATAQKQQQNHKNKKYHQGYGPSPDSSVSTAPVHNQFDTINDARYSTLDISQFGDNTASKFENPRDLTTGFSLFFFWVCSLGM
jgi:hypothetical protein